MDSGTKITMTGKFSLYATSPGRQWEDIFKLLKENLNVETKPQNSTPSKNSFQK